MAQSTLLKIETFPVGTLGCNCSLIYSPVTKESIVIDPGNDAWQVLKRVTEKGRTIKAILHTHAHFDHIGQSSLVKKKTGAPILLHQDDAFLYDALPAQGAFFGETIEPPSPCDHWIQDNEELSLRLQVERGGIESSKLTKVLSVLHTPGHTPGSCSFFTDLLESPVLFTGDTLFADSIGRTDLPGGDYEKIIKSIKTRILPLPDETRCIPGHGPLTSLYQERKHNPYL